MHERLTIERDALAHLLTQQAHFGAHTPAHIALEVAQRRAEIARLNAAQAPRRAILVTRSTP